jgi:hypothetical protein
LKKKKKINGQPKSKAKNGHTTILKMVLMEKKPAKKTGSFRHRTTKIKDKKYRKRRTGANTDHSNIVVNAAVPSSQGFNWFFCKVISR